MTGNAGINKSWFQSDSYCCGPFALTSLACCLANELRSNHKKDVHTPSVTLRYVTGQEVCHVLFLSENPPPVVHELLNYN